LGVCKKRELTQ